MNVELRQLEYFTAVCQERHFSRAADKLGISQPNLSLQIKALEQELGVKLFDRIGKRIMVTPAGEALYRHSCGVLTNVKNAYDELAEIHHSAGGKLSIGIIPSYLDDWLTPFLIDFHQKFRGVTLRVLSSLDIAKLVLETTVDVGIGLIPEVSSQLTVVPLYREEYGLVVSEQHPLARRESVSIYEFKTLPIVLYPHGAWGRDVIETACRQHGFGLNVVIETTSNRSLFRFVSENIGVTVHTRYVVQAAGHPNLRFVPIHDAPPCRDMGIMSLADRYLIRAARTFIQQAQASLTSTPIGLGPFR